MKSCPSLIQCAAATTIHTSPLVAPRRTRRSQQPGVGNTKPVPHSCPGLFQLLPRWASGPQIGRWCWASGPMAVATRGPVPVTRQTIFSSSPARAMPVMGEHQQGPHRTCRRRAVHLREPRRACRRRGWPTAGTPEHLTGRCSLTRRRRARRARRCGRLVAVGARHHAESRPADEDCRCGRSCQHPSHSAAALHGSSDLALPLIGMCVRPGFGMRRVCVQRLCCRRRSPATEDGEDA